MTRAPARPLVWALAALCVWAAGAAAAGAARASTDSRPQLQLSSLSCPATGQCSVAGIYEDSLGEAKGVFASESGGRWGPTVAAQPPAGAGANPFKAADGGSLPDIDCPAAGECAAVGRYADSTGIDRGVAFAERRGRWGRGVSLRLPANAIRPARPKSGATEDLNLYAVACAAVGNCVAVGTYETDAEVWEGLIVTETAGRWGRGTEAPLPAGAPVEGQDATLLSASCSPGEQSCTIAGDYVNAQGHQEALLVSGRGAGWSGGPAGWRAAPSPAAPADANSSPNVTPTSVSCADAADCAVVGTYINPLNNSLGLLLSESHGTWGGATGAQLPSGAAPAGTVGDQTTMLSSVACPAAGSCAAVGWYFDNYENGEGLIVSQQGGAWQPGTEVTLPANAVGGIEKQSAGLDWVSCASVGNCLATGVYTDLGDNSEGLLVSERDGVWQPATEAPLPAGAAGSQSAAVNQADCTGPGDCTAIGEYYDSTGRLLGLALTETGGSWGRPRAIALPDPSEYELRLSLQAITAPSGPRSGLAQIIRRRGFRFNYTAVAAGTAAVDWYARSGPAPVLIASGRVRVGAAAGAPLDVTLTPAGAALLAQAKNLQVSATATFTPRWHRLHTARSSTQFTLS